MGKSVKRSGFFGDYTEHYDDAGNKVGESREREGFFGDYTEHTDTSGNKTGESRERESFFGDYTEHTDQSGSKTGESHEREGFFGDYVEHTDQSGQKIGESRERAGFFNDYTEHSGGFHPRTRKNDSDAEHNSEESLSEYSAPSESYEPDTDDSADITSRSSRRKGRKRKKRKKEREKGNALDDLFNAFGMLAKASANGGSYDFEDDEGIHHSVVASASESGFTVTETTLTPKGKMIRDAVMKSIEDQQESGS